MSQGALFEDGPYRPTLHDQIAEIDRELAMRARVYPRLVSQGKLDHDKSLRAIATLQATRDVLAWLARHGPGVKHLAQSIIAAENAPEVQAILDTWPGAVVSSVTARR